MSSLLPIEKNKFERLFGMSTGYVLNFSDTTFAQFFFEVAEIDIHSNKYIGSGTSKANKLRSFWHIEPDAIVGKVLLALLDRWVETSDPNPDGSALLLQCRGVAARLAAGTGETDRTTDAAQLAEQIPPTPENRRANSTPFRGAEPTSSGALPATSGTAIPRPTLASLRRLLTEIFRSDTDLDAFCIDHFSTVYQRFTTGMNRIQKHNEILVIVDAATLFARLSQQYPEDLIRLSACIEYE